MQLTPTQLTWLRRRVRRDRHTYHRLMLKLNPPIRGESLYRIGVAALRAYQALVQLGWAVDAAELEAPGDWRGEGI